MSDGVEAGGGIKINLGDDVLKVGAKIEAKLDNIVREQQELKDYMKWQQSQRPYTESVYSMGAIYSSSIIIIPFEPVRRGRDVEVRAIRTGEPTWGPTVSNVSALICTGHPINGVMPYTANVRDALSIWPNGTFYSRGQFPLHEMEQLYIVLYGTGVTSSLSATAQATITSYPV